MATEVEIIDFLKTEPGQPFIAISRLSGGYTNWTWAVKVPKVEWKTVKDPETTGDPRLQQEPNIIIVKHARGHSATSGTLALAMSRQAVEYSALVQGNLLLGGGKIPPYVPARDALVGLPQVLRYDEDRHMIAMTSGGSYTLKEAYTSLDEKTLAEIAQRLYHWIRHFHTESVGKRTDVDEKYDGNQWAKEIYGYSYRELPTALQKYGWDNTTCSELAKRVNDRFGTLLTEATPQSVMCHGDYWPGNIILPERSSDPSSGPEGLLLPLTVVDWEMMRRDTSGITDLAQFAAEATLLDFFRGPKGFAAAFLSEVEQGMRDHEASDMTHEIRRFVAHWGVHVIFWPSRVPGWSDDNPDKLKAFAEYGLDSIKRALDGTTADVWEGLKKLSKISQTRTCA